MLISSCSIIDLLIDVDPQIRYESPNDGLWYTKTGVGNAGLYTFDVEHSHEFRSSWGKTDYEDIPAGYYDIGHSGKNIYGNWSGWFVSEYGYNFERNKKYTLIYHQSSSQTASGYVEVHKD